MLALLTASAPQQQREVARRIDTMPRDVRDSVLALHLSGRAERATSYYAAVSGSNPTTARQVTDSLVARHRLIYKYDYPHNTDDLIEDHYMVIDTIDGTMHGWYYGTTDDFDSGREGYLPGFFVAPMRELRFADRAIAFSIAVEADMLFTAPLPLTIRDARAQAAGQQRWRAVVVRGSRPFRGVVGRDRVALQLERGMREFRRVR